MSHCVITQFTTLAIIHIDLDQNDVIVLNRGSICCYEDCQCEKDTNHVITQIYSVDPHWFERFCYKYKLNCIMKWFLGRIETLSFDKLKKYTINSRSW